jgi:hypothetical protein
MYLNRFRVGGDLGLSDDLIGAVNDADRGALQCDIETDEQGSLIHSSAPATSDRGPRRRAWHDQVDGRAPAVRA